VFFVVKNILPQGTQRKHKGHNLDTRHKYLGERKKVKGKKKRHFERKRVFHDQRE